MKKLTFLLLILMLLVVTLSCVSCGATESDGSENSVVSQVLGDDTAFARQIANFKPFMQTKHFFGKLMESVKEIANVLDGIKLDSIFGVLGLIVAVVANWAAWAAAIIVYGLCTIVMILYDVILLIAYACVFIMLYLVYSVNSLLLLFA